LDNNILSTSSAIPLTLTAVESTTVQLNQVGSGLPTVQYSTDNTTWNNYT